MFDDTAHTIYIVSFPEFKAQSLARGSVKGGSMGLLSPRPEGAETCDGSLGLGGGVSSFKVLSSDSLSSFVEEGPQ